MWLAVFTAFSDTLALDEPSLRKSAGRQRGSTNIRGTSTFIRQSSTEFLKLSVLYLSTCSVRR